MNFLSVLKLIVQLLPLVLEAVKAAEAAIPQSGQGKAKFEFVKELLTDTSGLISEYNASDYNSAVEKAINLAVKLYNSVGLFKK